MHKLAQRLRFKDSQKASESSTRKKKVMSLQVSKGQNDVRFRQIHWYKMPESGRLSGRNVRLKMETECNKLAVLSEMQSFKKSILTSFSADSDKTFLELLQTPEYYRWCTKNWKITLQKLNSDSSFHKWRSDYLDDPQISLLLPNKKSSW